jgi:hypothetical protein
MQPDDRQRTIEPIRWPAPVLRVTVRWDGAQWIIDRVIRVDSMTLPAPDELPAGENSRGFWIEAVDRQGRVRHRQIMADPLAGMEQFDDKGLVTRMRHPLENIAIEVLVPGDIGLAELHLVSNPPAPHASHGGEKRAGRTKLTLSDRDRPPQDDRDDDHGHRDDHDHPGGGHDHDHGGHGHDHGRPGRGGPR